MKRLTTAIAALCASTAAWADKYGIDEAMAESGDADLGDMVLGGLIIWGLWALWKKFFG